MYKIIADTRIVVAGIPYEAGAEVAGKGLHPFAIELELLRAIARSIQINGALLWFSGPVWLAFACLKCDCHDGVPAYIYIAPMVLLVINKTSEISLMQRLRESSESSLTALRPAIQSFDSLKLVDSSYVLVAVGCTLILDFVTDHFQAVQAYTCDLAIKRQYAETWRAFSFLDHEARTYIHLWYLFAFMLCLIYVVQGARGFVQAVACVRTEWGFINGPTTHSSGFFYRENGKQLAIYGADQDERDAIPEETFGQPEELKFYEELAVVAEWSGMIALSRMLRHCAAECATKQEGVADYKELFWPIESMFAGPTNPKIFEQIAKASHASSVGVLMRSIVTYVLCENAPSMWLTSAFFSIQLDHLTVFGIIKASLSFCLSASSAMSKAKDAMQGQSRRSCGVGILIILFVILASGKMVSAFFCESHFFSYLTWTCVKKVQAY